MKYKEVLEPNRGLLFKLVEFNREYAESGSGVIPFLDHGFGHGLDLGSGSKGVTLGRYSTSNVNVLERLVLCQA